MSPDLYSIISSKDKVTGKDLRDAGLVVSSMAGHRKLLLLEGLGEVKRNKDGRSWSLVKEQEMIS